jgi:hypothetical protein
MRLIAELWHPDIAFLPIGGHYTMDPDPGRDAGSPPNGPVGSRPGGHPGPRPGAGGNHPDLNRGAPSTIGARSRVDVGPSGGCGRAPPPAIPVRSFPIPRKDRCKLSRPTAPSSRPMPPTAVTACASSSSG